MGRPPEKPSVDDEEAVRLLCEHLVSGLSIVAACKLPECPSHTAVYVKMAKDEAFRTIIAGAREAQQDAEIDKTIDLADGATAENHHAVKLQIWARQWRASKLAPKKYGDKTTIDVGGKVATVNLTTTDPVEAARAYQQIMGETE